MRWYSVRLEFFRCSARSVPPTASPRTSRMDLSRPP